LASCASCSALLLLAVWLGTVSPGAAADVLVDFGPYDIRSAFYVAKSENKNEVHYAVHVDAACRPLGKLPVFGYWQRLRKGKRVDEPLEGPGVRLYGASTEQKVVVGTTGGRIGMFVRALERVPVDMRLHKTPTGCAAQSYVSLKRERARLSYAFLQLGRFGLSVKYVDVVGFRERDGQRVTEQFR
jgi:hypothetical protein